MFTGTTLQKKLLLAEVITPSNKKSKSIYKTVHNDCIHTGTLRASVLYSDSWMILELGQLSSDKKTTCKC